MTEHTNLETVDAYLASVILPQGNTLPSPLVVLSDDTPLYDEPALLAEMEAALAEERAAKLTGEIINIETYNSTLITVTFSGIDLVRTYRVNVPRQLVQVGYLYNRLLNADACSLLTESEVNLNRDFTHDKDHLSGEFLPPFLSEDIMIRLKFPKDMSEETREAYNFILHDLSTDFTEGLTKEQVKELTPKVRLAVTAAESRRVRGDIISLLLRLSDGDEDALVELYKYAEQVEKAKEALDRNALLTDEERNAVIIFEFVSGLAASLNPDILVQNIEEIHKSLNPQAAIKKAAEEEDAPAGLNLDSLFSDEDFQSSLNEIVSEFRKDNPESVTLTEDSTYEERVEYLTLPTNVVPMMGGLMTLADRLNLDLYYSHNWNQQVSEEDAGTRGEFLIVLVLLAIQRMYMYGKSIDADMDNRLEARNLIIALAADGLEQPTDRSLWVLRDSLYRAGRGNNDNLNQFFLLSLDQTDNPAISVYGQVMHWLGHTMIEDGHQKEALLSAFSGLPHFETFISAIYADMEKLMEHEHHPEFLSDDDDDEEEVEELCFVTSAVMDMLAFEEEVEDPQASDFELMKESGAALVRFAEFCLRKNEPTMREGSREWKEALGLYLARAVGD